MRLMARSLINAPSLSHSAMLTCALLINLLNLVFYECRTNPPLTDWLLAWVNYIHWFPLNSAVDLQLTHHMAFTVVSTIFISSFAFYTIIIRPFRPVSSKVKNLGVVLLPSCDITRFHIVESAIFRYYFSFYTTIRRFCPESNIISFISSQCFTFFCLSFCLWFFISISPFTRQFVILFCTRFSIKT